jgi:hypothetical protein
MRQGIPLRSEPPHSIPCQFNPRPTLAKESVSAMLEKAPTFDPNNLEGITDQGSFLEKL